MQEGTHPLLPLPAPSGSLGQSARVSMICSAVHGGRKSHAPPNGIAGRSKRWKPNSVWYHLQSRSTLVVRNARIKNVGKSQSCMVSGNDTLSLELIADCEGHEGAFDDNP